MDYKIYTDGSCLGNPGAGGYAAIIIDASGKCEEIFGSASQTTNNRMELMAAIMALKKVTAEDFVELFTDSAYLRNAFTQGWLANWKRKGWLGNGNFAVRNKDLWIKLDKLIEDRSVKFSWVKGHSGNDFNERCDKLARNAALTQKNQLSSDSQSNEESKYEQLTLF